MTEGEAFEAVNETFKRHFKEGDADDRDMAVCFIGDYGEDTANEFILLFDGACGAGCDGCCFGALVDAMLKCRTRLSAIFDNVAPSTSMLQ